MKLMLAILVLGLLVACGAAQPNDVPPADNGQYAPNGASSNYESSQQSTYSSTDPSMMAGYGSHHDGHDSHGFDYHHDWLSPGGAYYWSYPSTTHYYNSWWYQPTYYSAYYYPEYYYYTTPVVYSSWYTPAVYNWGIDPWYATNVYGMGGTAYYSSSSTWTYKSGFGFLDP